MPGGDHRQATALSMVNSFKRVISPGLVLAYAALQGLFVGAFSKSMEAYFGDGLVMGAVLMASSMLILGNLIADLLLAVADPRIAYD